jgi:hypothetical protein
MLDPCGVMAGSFADMSPEYKHTAISGALGKGESVVKNNEHVLRVSGIGKTTPAEEVPIETLMQSQMSGGSEAQLDGALAAAVGQGSHMLPESHMHRENV